MEIRNLITFVHVAELNSFTKAARALDYSQSTVSFQIKQLETELDCLLFERVNHTINLTEKGRELLEYAQQISHLTDEFNYRRNAENTPEGCIHVVAPDSVCEDMLLNHYSEFHKKYPKISLKFTTADTEGMFRMIDHNEADIMLTLDNHIYKSEYIIAIEEPVSMHFVAAAESEFAEKTDVSFDELIKFPFVLTEKGVGYRRIFDEAIAMRSQEITPVLEVGRTDVIASLVENGAGVSLLPDFVTRKKVEEGRLAYINVDGIEFYVWKQLLYHKNKWISRSTQALIDYIKNNEFGN